MPISAVPSSRSRESLSEAIALYRRLLRRYRKIEALSSQALRTLRTGCEVRELNAALERKRALWEQIREEEQKGNEARESWKRSRAGLPAEECRELLSLFEAIGKTLEDAIAQEDECRALMTERIAGKRSTACPVDPAETSPVHGTESPLSQGEPR